MTHGTQLLSLTRTEHGSYGEALLLEFSDIRYQTWLHYKQQECAGQITPRPARPKERASELCLYRYTDGPIRVWVYE